MANIAQKAINANAIKNRSATVGNAGAIPKSYEYAPSQKQPSTTELNSKYSTRFDDVNWYVGGAPSGT